MLSFRIEGGNPLHGAITPQGAKNEALQVISASLLTSEPVVIHNIPDIRDVNALIDILSDLGVIIDQLGNGSYWFKAENIDITYLETETYNQKASTLRGSIMILGPLLARYKKAKIPRPGGDKIGRRRLDTHFFGFEKLGAKFNYNKNHHFFSIDASNLKGNFMLLDEASVTGTANIVMASNLPGGKSPPHYRRTAHSAGNDPHRRGHPLS